MEREHELGYCSRYYIHAAVYISDSRGRLLANVSARKMSRHIPRFRDFIRRCNTIIRRRFRQANIVRPVDEHHERRLLLSISSRAASDTRVAPHHTKPFQRSDARFSTGDSAQGFDPRCKLLLRARIRSFKDSFVVSTGYQQPPWRNDGVLLGSLVIRARWSRATAVWMT
jgi:hypothetical protein